MEGLLTLFVALTTIAIITQAGVLLGIYFMSKRLSEQVERFMKETREMMVPIRSIADNLRTASANLVEIGLSARDQFRSERKPQNKKGLTETMIFPSAVCFTLNSTSF